MANEIKGLVNITTGQAIADADARYLPTTAYAGTFTNANLVGGVLSVLHSLGQQVVNVMIAKRKRMTGMQ